MQVQERSAKLYLHDVIVICKTALLEKFDRHNDHHLSNVRQRINEHAAGYDIRKPKMKPIYLGYLNPSNFFCKGINNYYIDLILSRRDLQTGGEIKGQLRGSFLVKFKTA